MSKQEQNKAFKMRIVGHRLTEPKQEDMFYYDIRHSDSDMGKPVTIENRVAVNFYGTIISTHDLSGLLKDGKDYYKLNNREREIIFEHEDGDSFNGNELFPEHPEKPIRVSDERKIKLYDGMLGYLVELIHDQDDLRLTLKVIGFTDEEINLEL